MNTKQNSKSKTLILSTIIAIVLLGGLTAFLVIRNSTQVSADTTKNSPAASHFSFIGATGWWQGATNETSMALFDKNETKACFTSAEYIAGTVDISPEVQKTQNLASLKGDGYVVTSIGVKEMNIQTSEGEKTYSLHQSSVVTPAGFDKLKGGQEFGFVELTNGYIKIMGYCDTPEQLANTLPSLQAIKFSDTIK